MIPRNTSPRIVTRQEAAHLLTISIVTIDRMIARGALRATKIGRRVLVSLDDIETLLEPLNKRSA